MVNSSNDNVQIRPVQAFDAVEWRRMRMALWPDCGDEHIAEIRRFFEQGSWTGSPAFLSVAVFVATRPTRGLCGFAEVSLRPYVDGCDTFPVGYLEGWFVDPDRRRQGVGGLLVASAQRWAMEQGSREMASDALLENEMSLQAHQALGFEETSRTVHFRKRLKEDESGP